MSRVYGVLSTYETFLSAQGIFEELAWLKKLAVNNHLVESSAIAALKVNSWVFQFFGSIHWWQDHNILQVLTLFEGVYLSRDRLYVIRIVQWYIEACYIKYYSVVLSIHISHSLYIIEERLTPPAIEICLYAAAPHAHFLTSFRSSSILSHLFSRRLYLSAPLSAISVLGLATPPRK